MGMGNPSIRARLHVASVTALCWTLLGSCISESPPHSPDVCLAHAAEPPAAASTARLKSTPQPEPVPWRKAFITALRADKFECIEQLGRDASRFGMGDSELAAELVTHHAHHFYWWDRSTPDPLEVIGPVALDALISEPHAVNMAHVSNPAFRGFRPEWAGAENDLIARLQGADERTAIALGEWLANVEGEGPSALGPLLANASKDLRVPLLMVASARRKLRAPLIESLGPFLADEDDETRYWACFALGSQLPDSLDMLLQAADDADPRIRACVFESIDAALNPRFATIRLGDPYVSALEKASDTWQTGSALLHERLRSEATLERALRRGLLDPDDAVSLPALRILYKVCTWPEATRAILLELTRNESRVRRFWAQATLEQKEPGRWRELLGLRESRAARIHEPGTSLPATDLALLSSLKSESHAWKITITACDSILPELIARAEELTRPGFVDAVQVLERMTSILHTKIQAEWELAMSGMNPGDYAGGLLDLGAACHPLMSYHALLDSEECLAGGWQDGESAMWVLAHSGTAGVPVLTLCMQQFECDSELRELGCSRLIASIPGGLELGAPFLLAHWHRAGLYYGRWSTNNDWDAGAVGQIFKNADECLEPWILRGLRSHRAVVRSRSCAAAACLGPRASDAIRLELERLGLDPSAEVREAAAHALASLGN